MNILIASEIGDDKTLKNLLAVDHPDINYTNDSNETPLLLACKFNHSKCCSLLLDAGAVVDQCDSVGNSPLHFAEDIDTVIRLLDLGADPTLRNVKERTPLHEAALWGSTERFKALLHEISNRKCSVDVVDDQGFTPLHLAVFSVIEENRLEKISLLLSAGAEINRRNCYGMTPLRLSCTNFGLTANTAVHLLRCGANPHVTDSYGNTCLHAIFKFNPYYYPSEQDALEVMKILKELITMQCNMNIRNKNGQTALHYAAYSSSSEPVKILLENGANPCLVDHIGRTPLHKCMYNIDVKVVELVLQYSKCPSTVDYLGRNPLHYATAHGKPETVETILKAISLSAQGIDNSINQSDHSGLTPLHYFLLYKRKEESILSSLLQHGANTNMELPSGLTCPTMAKYSKDISQMIFQAGSQDSINCLPSCELLLVPQAKSLLNDYLQPMYINTDRQIDPLTLRPTANVEEYLQIIYSLTIPSDEQKELQNCMNSSIENFVKNLCEEIATIDPRFASVVIPSGSTYEETKPVTESSFLTDFDYMICLAKLSEEIEVEETPNLVGHVKLVQKKPSDNSNFKEFFSDGYLVGERVSKAFCDLMVLVMNQSKIWQNGEMECPCIPTLESPVGSPTIKLDLYWKKDLMHAREVSIDIVPAIQVKSWWPSFARQDSSILTPETQECHIVLKQPAVGCYNIEKFGNPSHLLRVSFSVAELELFQKMPPIVKRSCVVIKVLSKRPAEVPLWMIYGEEYDKKLMAKILTKHTLSSYVLKNALFHELEALYGNDGKIFLHSPLALKALVCGTFGRLGQASEEHLLPGFFAPKQNLFQTYERNDGRGKFRDLAIQLINLSLQEGGRNVDVKIHDFPEGRNNSVLGRRQVKIMNILTKLGHSWIN